MKKISLSILILSIVSLSACMPPTSSTTQQNGNTQTPVNDMITLEGVVNDPSDKPIEGVKITIKDNNKVIGEAVTDSNGKYSVKVPKVFGEAYLIDAKKDVSDGNLSQTILINSGQIADFTGKNKLVKTQVASNPTPIQ